jgi:hypothetical protein
MQTKVNINTLGADITATDLQYICKKPMHLNRPLREMYLAACYACEVEQIVYQSCLQFDIAPNGRNMRFDRWRYMLIEFECLDRR